MADDAPPSGLVRIEWVDSAFVQEGWATIESVREHGARVTGLAISVGHLIADAPEYVTLCLSYQPPEGGAAAMVADCMSIPRVAIRKISVMRRVRG